MKNRVGLLLGCLVILSLCLSPQISLELIRGEAEPAYTAATREALYVPPVRASVRLAPTLTGSVAGASRPEAGAGDREQWAPLVIETPEPDYLALEFDGAYAFMLEGSGEPGAEVELFINNAPQSRKVATVDAKGRWRIGASREDLREGEVYCALRYVHDWDSETAWSSRLPGGLPELLLPAYVAAGTKRLTGFVQGDARIKASVEGESLLCLQSQDGSFSVMGITNLASGTEIMLTAVDALGNRAEAVCMVVRPESAALRFAADAPQAYQYLRNVPDTDDAPAEDEAPAARPTEAPLALPAPKPAGEVFFPK